MAELKYWIWLSTRKIGKKSMASLLEYFGTPDAVYFARDEEYKYVSGLKETKLDTLADKGLSESFNIINECRRRGFDIITYGDADYPTRLKNIYDPPVVLYIKGKLPLIDDEAVIGIVGTRNCTPYGLKASERMGYEIALGGGVVVTGLARGIDSSAAIGALKADGKVIGVIGSGLDIVYPRENLELFARVCLKGALVSEYPPHTEPSGGHFPERNRIISGMAVGVLVIEAPTKSGALITASRALEQGRDIFAVPGNIDSDSCQGSNELLKEGAMPALSGTDILSEYIGLYPDKLSLENMYNMKPSDEKISVKSAENKTKYDNIQPNNTEKVIDKEKVRGYIDLKIKTEDLSETEKSVLSAIEADGTHIDDIIEKVKMPASEVLSAMTMLEINGAVTQKPGRIFVKHIY